MAGDVVASVETLHERVMPCEETSKDNFHLQ